MNLTILDTNLEPLAILDTYESLIWTDRYQAYGDLKSMSQSEMMDFLAC